MSSSQKITKLGRTITVAKTGGDYASVFNAINDALAGDTILISPGTYNEPPMTIPANISIRGVDRLRVVIQATDINNPLFTVSGQNTGIHTMAITGATNSDGILDNSGGATSQFVAISFNNCLHGIHSDGLHSFPSCEDISFAANITIGYYSTATGSGGGVIIIMQSDATTAVQADSGFVLITSFAIVGGTNAIFANGGVINCSVSNVLSSTNILRANNGGVITGSSIDSSLSNSTLDIMQEDATSVIKLNSCRFNSDKMQISNADLVVIDFDDEKEGDEGLTLMKELHVGYPEKGYETALGQGDSYTRGMLVYTEDTGNAFVDVSSKARSITGSIFTFPGVAANNRIYVASSLENGDVQKHCGIKVIVEIAAVLGAGEIVAEYWNGSAWIEFNHMSTDASGEYFPHADNIFERVSTDQIRYSNDACVLSVKNDPMALGTDYYWNRFSIKTAITTAPVFQQFKLHTNRTEINADGWMEYFGDARPQLPLPWDWNTFSSGGTNSPGNQPLFALNAAGGTTQDIVIGRVENSFGTGSVRRVGMCFYAPFDIDTSNPIELRWTFKAQALGDVVWFINFGISRDGDVIGNNDGSAPVTMIGEEHLSETVAVSVINEQITASKSINISEVISRRSTGESDVLWISIAREGNTGSDTVNGNANMIQISPVYTRWSEGSHL